MSDAGAKWQRYLPPTGDDEGRAVRLSDENRAWLAEQGVTLDTLVTLERVRHRYPEVESELHRAVSAQPAKARVLRYLALQGEQASETYDTLVEASSSSRRTVRHHVRELEQHGLVARSDGRPKRVGWAEPAVYLLATDLFARETRAP